MGERRATPAALFGHCFREARPTVQVIFLLRYCVGVLLCAHGGFPAARVGLGALGWSCTTFAIYLFNGVADYPEDAANGSGRPIARGLLPVRFALGTAVTAALLGGAAGFALGPGCAALTLLYLLIGYAYSGRPYPLKRNFSTASLAGGLAGLLTYLAGAVAVGGPAGNGALLFAVAMSAWMGGVGGIAKDLSDVAGDRLAGRRTWPVVFGESRARLLLIAAAATVGTAFVVGAATVSVRMLWCAATLCAGALAITAVSARMPADAPRGRSRLPYRVFMWTQYAGHAVVVGVTAALVR